MAERVEKLTIEIGGRNRAGGVFADVERGLDRIKAKLGPRGFLKDLTEVAVGGGAVAGLNFFTNTLARGAESMRDMFDEVREGKREIGDVVSESARMLPVLGGAVRFWDAIKESITGARSEVARLNADTEKAYAKIKERSERNARFDNAGKQIQDLADQRAQELSSSAGSPFAEIFRIRSGAARSRTALDNGPLKSLGEAIGASSSDPQVILDKLVALRIERAGLSKAMQGGFPTLPATGRIYPVGQRLSKTDVAQGASVDTSGRYKSPFYETNTSGFYTLSAAGEAQRERYTNASDRARTIDSILTKANPLAAQISQMRQGIFSEEMKSYASAVSTWASTVSSGILDTAKKAWTANINSPAVIERAVSGGNLQLSALAFSQQLDALRASQFSMLLAGPGGGADPILAGINQTAAARQSAVGTALGLAESSLARMQAGRGGGSSFATADTRRGITGVRSIGGGASEMSQAEKETIAVIKELKKEQEKSNKLSDEVKALLGPSLRNIEKFLNPESEL